MKTKTKLLAIALWLLVISAVKPETANAAAAANLSQGRNGTDSIPVNPMNWANGNLGTGTAHYIEGMSAPYQCIMTGLTIGAQVTLTIGYDIRNSSRHAIDYLTHYDRILPHDFNVHTTPETINPLTGSGLGGATAFTTYPIPVPSSAGSPMSGQPGNSFNALPSNERLMTLYNGTIDTIYYAAQGNLTAASSETRVTIRFTPAGATTVLVWGGHIGSRIDWGYISGSNPNSAGGISGSPFHMRLVGWNLGNLGNTDRSLAGSTVWPPQGSLPVELINFAVYASGKTNVIEWTTASEINNDYFILERSADANYFEHVAVVQGAGNSSVTRNYSMTDNAPLSGISYYRLLQTDFDGANRIYGPLSIKRSETTAALSVSPAYPNPFTDDLTISYSSSNKASTLIEINDSGGKRVAHQTVSAKAGANSFHYTGFQLTEGIYFITISQAGEKPVTTVIIKQ